MWKRWSRRRRIAVVSGSAAGALLILGAALGFWVWLPAEVEARAVAAGARFGLDVRIEDVSPRLQGVVLEGVTARAGGDAIVVEASEIGVRGGLWAMAFEGAAGMDEVQARGVAIRIDAKAPRFADAMRKLRDARRDAANAEAGPAAEPRPRFAASSVELTVADRFGALAQARLGELARERDGALRVSAERAQVGAAPEDLIAVTALDAVVRRAGGPLRIERLVVGGAEVTFAQREGERTPEQEQRTTRARLGALLSAGAPPPGRDDEPDPAWFERIAPGARLAISNATIESRTAEGEETILQQLHVELAARDAGAGGSETELQLRGAGVTGTGGRARWDFRVDPVHVRGEGSLGFQGISFALIAPLLPDIPWADPEDAELDGELELRSESTDRISVRGRIHLENAAVSSPRIAPQPVRQLGFTIDGEGAWLPGERRLEIARGTIQSGQAQVHLAGTIEWAPDHYLFHVDATLPVTPCQRAIEAIPRDLLADAAGFRWRGSMGGRLAARIDSRDLDATTFTVSIADGCTFADVPGMADLRRFDGPFLHRVQEPDGTTFEMTTGPGTGAWTPIHEISPYLIHAVLAHEDTGFFRHRGFTPMGIREALVRNLKAGRYVQGASTITMQLVKNIFLHREKTLARKVQEVILTWWLESSMPKQEILELYLNVIEYGPGVYGIRAAAEHYFGRHPSELSPAESVYLSTILPNPKRYHSHYERGSLPPAWSEKMRRILQRLGDRGWIDAAALAYGLDEVNGFGFHREGAPPPAPRVIPGRAGELPIQHLDTGGWGGEGAFEEETMPYEEEPGALDESG